MKIAVNLRLYVKGKIGGLENYIRHIVPALDARQSAAGSPLIVFAHVKEAGNVRELAPAAHVIPVVHDNAVAAMESELARGNFDLLFCPLLVLDPMKVKIPSAVMMPDLQHEFFPGILRFEHPRNGDRQTYRPSTIHATQIFTLSEHAKKTIVDNFRIDPAKIQVIYLDVDDEFRGFQPGGPPQRFGHCIFPRSLCFIPLISGRTRIIAICSKRVQDPGGKRPESRLLYSRELKQGGEQVRKQKRETRARENVFLPGYVDR